MKIDKNNVVLFVEPENSKSDEPVLDIFTIKMFNAFMAHTKTGVVWSPKKEFIPDLATKGVHFCTGKDCDKISANIDYLLSSGQATNSLCVHYLAHHRDEIPSAELDKVHKLEVSEVLTNEKELQKML